MYESIKRTKTSRSRDAFEKYGRKEEYMDIWTSAQERKKEKKEGDETKYEEQKKNARDLARNLFIVFNVRSWIFQINWN